jgi:hypothetical protein
MAALRPDIGLERAEGLSRCAFFKFVQIEETYWPGRR